ncbi:hypothetical protein DFH28DRAFT_877444, partial [Melampsora americana]
TRQVRGRRLSYATVRRAIGNTSLAEYLRFAGLTVRMIRHVLPILVGQHITDFHYFVFGDHISAGQLCFWGIPYGICVRLLIHAEPFYQYVIDR